MAEEELTRLGFEDVTVDACGGTVTIERAWTATDGTGNTDDTATVVTDGLGVVQSTSSLNIRPGIQQSIDDASAAKG